MLEVAACADSRNPNQVCAFCGGYLPGTAYGVQYESARFGAKALRHGLCFAARPAEQRVDQRLVDTTSRLQGVRPRCESLQFRFELAELEGLDQEVGCAAIQSTFHRIQF